MLKLPYSRATARYCSYCVVQRLDSCSLKSRSRRFHRLRTFHEDLDRHIGWTNGTGVRRLSLQDKVRAGRR